MGAPVDEVRPEWARLALELRLQVASRPVERTVIWHDSRTGAALILETLHPLGVEPPATPQLAEPQPAAAAEPVPATEPATAPPVAAPSSEPATPPEVESVSPPEPAPADGGEAGTAPNVALWQPSGAGGTATGNPSGTSQAARPSWGLSADELAAQQAGGPPVARPTWATPEPAELDPGA